MAAYCSIWSGSALVWLLFDVSGQTQKPFSSIAAVGFVASVPFAVAGSLLFSLRRGSRLPVVVRALDAVTVAAALMLICWVPVLERVFDLSRFGVGSELMSLGIPVGDLVVVTLMWSAISSSASRLRPSLIAVGVGSFPSRSRTSSWRMGRRTVLMHQARCSTSSGRQDS